MTNKNTSWQKARQYTEEQLHTAAVVLEEIRSGTDTMQAVHAHPLSKGGYIAKHMLVHVYRQKVKEGNLEADGNLLARIRMKPMRSLSGVSTVTVLTKPYPCPGNCIFCPDDRQLPKSYLRDEPGAARAFQNEFDPYRQVRSRLDSYLAIGHPINKIELLILGGSWSAYPADYRAHFVKRCLDALNGKDAPNLKDAQTLNEKSESRNVGLVVETRPDMINPQEIAHMRELGVTKVQMGAQSFDNEILLKNQRGHSVEDTLHAAALLRAAGFKIVLHWMPNLLGATPDSDREDFQHMWDDGFCPDELKIYPTQLLEDAPLYNLWKQGKFKPYTTDILINLIADIKPSIPIYSRVNRIVRDIPANYIKAGSRRSSLRQDVHIELKKRGQSCRCIRCREIKGTAVDTQNLIFEDYIYHAAFAEEHFLNYSTHDDRLAGYLRLAIPAGSSDPIFTPQRKALFTLVPELEDAALIREVHIYGQSLTIGSEQIGAAQHSGLGTTLLKIAEQTAKNAGYSKLVVIAAIGTRLYYEKRGFIRSGLYMTKKIV
ncbi:MAG: tRNA uridine(34) 5-carboxymethylaminomethyl modification radical SAM/GNAT enzyme Elp3 [Anaerolineaceae bacterium]|nr:tRNA uridine(34) 5-carboxymethylaminomethyl modification radical SAM/GNAT enzyme Elp3 [Anaerolineaceae bacterium]